MLQSSVSNPIIKIYTYINSGVFFLSYGGKTNEKDKYGFWFYHYKNRLKFLEFLRNSYNFYIFEQCVVFTSFFL